MNCQRDAFQLRPNVHYLNNAYKAPLLKVAENAAIEALQKARNPQDISPESFFSETEEVQKSFASIINAKPEEIAIIPSVSYAICSVLANLPCKPGQHAITVQDEFPSDFFAIERWCKEHDAPLKVIGPDPEASQMGPSWHEKLLAAINPSTAVVVISSVHWANGLKFDLETIGNRCHEVGAILIVDGTQSVGALPIDVQQCKIDVLICADYKWLLGPYSLGLAYIGPAFHEGRPLEESWMNRTNAKDFSSLADYGPNYTAAAGRYNVGETSNFILMPMLNASLHKILEWGPENIQAYAGRLRQPLMDYLHSHHFDLEAPHYTANHLFGLKMPPQYDPEKVKAALTAQNIILSRRGNRLRISVNVYNTEADIEALIGAFGKW